MGYDFDTRVFILGVLCPRSHRHNGSDYSLRYRNGKHKCVKCRALFMHRYWKKNKRKIMDQHNEYMKNKELI